MKTRIVLGILFAIGLAAVIIPAVLGWDYYTLSVEQRARVPHEQRTHGSGGPIGHGYGIAGSLIMLLNFLYLIRRRMGSQGEKFGNMRQWMHFHVFVGLLGPILIFYHTAFVMSNLFAKISLFALIIVVVTGIFGRFIYATIPRDIHGHEQTQAQLITQLQGITTAFQQQSEQRIDEHLKSWLPPANTSQYNAPTLILFLLAEQLRFPFRLFNGTRQLTKHFGLAKQEAKHTAMLWLRHRRFSFLVEVLERHRKTFSSWRALHRTLTYIMVLTAIVHVFIATVGFGLL